MKSLLFEDVIRDNVSGSGAIVRKVQQRLIDFFHDKKVMTYAALNRDIQSLKTEFPQFGLLFHFLKAFEKTFSTSSQVEYAEVQRFVEQYRNQWNNVQHLAIRHLLESVNLEGKNILLHSNSSTVQQLFKSMSTGVQKPAIYQTLSSPANEGLVQAKSLKALGFKITLFHEDALSKYVNKMDMAILGADLILDDRFLNKIGSFGLVLLCRYFKKPVYVIADRRKKYATHELSENERALFEVEPPKPAEEIIGQKIPGIKVLNEYFEFVPLNLVEALFV